MIFKFSYLVSQCGKCGKCGFDPRKTLWNYILDRCFSIVRVTNVHLNLALCQHSSTNDYIIVNMKQDLHLERTEPTLMHFVYFPCGWSSDKWTISCHFTQGNSVVYGNFRDPEGLVCVCFLVFLPLALIIHIDHSLSSVYMKHLEKYEDSISLRKVVFTWIFQCKLILGCFIFCFILTSNVASVNNTLKIMFYNLSQFL